mmetsp:Transcript_27888/g.38936  ORF Transcript_27888/g.38936 Transcript_27888/m.38936 type:complete len:204 (+) Transcript_27888:3-614(+)
MMQRWSRVGTAARGRLQWLSTKRRFLLGATTCSGGCLAMGTMHFGVLPTLPPPFGQYVNRSERWLKKQPPAILQILAANTIVFAMWRLPALQTMMYRNFTCSFASLASGRIHTTLTSVFSHQGFFHFGLNMYALTSFAPVLVDIMGHAQFLQFYVGSGIASSLASCSLQAAHYTVRRSAYVLSRPGLGASGAVFAMVLETSLH